MTRLPATDILRPVRLIMYLLIIAALYFGRDVLMPTALAILLTFLLYPTVNRLRRLGVPRVAAVAITVTAALTVTGAVGYVVGRQLLDLTTKLPDYRDNLRAKVRDIRSSGSGQLARISGTISELKEELSTSQPATMPATVSPVPGAAIVVPKPAPLKVEVVSDGPSMGAVAASVAAPLLFPIAEAAITLLLLIFILLHTDDIRERLITIAGMRQISLTTAAMDEAGGRIGGFLRMQALVNLCYGVMIALGLAAFGVPNAILWGVLGMLLRFVPYLGPWIAAAMPTLLTFAVFPGWARPIGVIGMLCVVELITNMILEPWLYANSAGISSLGVVVAAVFWAWVWGPVGMILAVPITACLVVMGKYFPQLSLLHRVFGCDVIVPTVGRLYERLLVGDDASAEQIVDKEISNSSLAEACDSLLLPTLSELKRDASAGMIQPDQVRRSIEILDIVCEARATAAGRKTILFCVPAQGEIDAAAARLLVCAAAEQGIAADSISSHALASEVAQRAQDSGAKWVAVVQVPPVSSLHARRLIRAVQSRLGDNARVIDLRYSPADAPAARAGNEEAASTSLRRESSIAGAVARLRELAQLRDKDDTPSAEPVAAGR